MGSLLYAVSYFVLGVVGAIVLGVSLLIAYKNRQSIGKKVQQIGGFVNGGKSSTKQALGVIGGAYLVLWVTFVLLLPEVFGAIWESGLFVAMLLLPLLIAGLFATGKKSGEILGKILVVILVLAIFAEGHVFWRGFQEQFQEVRKEFAPQQAAAATSWCPPTPNVNHVVKVEKTSTNQLILAPQGAWSQFYSVQVNNMVFSAEFDTNQDLCFATITYSGGVAVREYVGGSATMPFIPDQKYIAFSARSPMSVRLVGELR